MKIDNSLYRVLILIGISSFLFVACGDSEQGDQKSEVKQKKQRKTVSVPEFDPDSAYSYIASQVEFGPRVPNTPSHKKCAEYLENKLIDYGFKTMVQKGKVTAYNGKKLQIRNIIGRLNPGKAERVMLYAHWDSRQIADKDDDRKEEPIPGANDGASGVGVLLEIARNLSEQNVDIGVDIHFFDAEDHGQPEGTGVSNRKRDTWCLGTQYWAKNPPIKNYAPKYGILLDMVGAKGATFPKERISLQYAGWLVEKVWRTADRIGYSDYFVNRRVGPITDDHLYVNRLARIPSINIVHINPETGEFGDFHHTHEDNMDIISKETLKAVGQTVMEVIYRE